MFLGRKKNCPIQLYMIYILDEIAHRLSVTKQSFFVRQSPEQAANFYEPRKDELAKKIMYVIKTLTLIYS